MLLQLFVDDERSVADWPFVRLLRTRKWLVLSAVIGHLYGGDYIRWEALTAVLGGVIVIRHEILWYGAVVPLAVFTGQYFVNLYQAWLVHSETYRRRFNALDVGTVAAAKQGLEEAADALQSLLVDPEHTRLLDRAGELEALRRTAARPPLIDESEETKLARMRARKDLDRIIAAVRTQNEVQERVNRAIAKDQLISQFDPTRIKGYRFGEWTLDFFRVAPAFAIAISAWFALLAT